MEWLVGHVELSEGRIFSLTHGELDMNIHRKVLSIVAGTLLLASLPAGAQVLGGGVGGAMNGTLGGPFNRTGIHGAAAGNAGVDASDTVGAARDRAARTGNRGRDIAAGAYGTASSRAESARGAAAADAATAQSTGVNAGRRAARSASQTSTIAQADAAQASTASSDGAFVGNAGGAGIEQRAMGRRIAADGAAGSQTRGDRSTVTSSSYGEAGVSAQKE